MDSSFISLDITDKINISCTAQENLCAPIRENLFLTRAPKAEPFDAQNIFDVFLNTFSYVHQRLKIINIIYEFLMYITQTSSGRLRMRGDAAKSTTEINIFSGHAANLSDNREDEKVRWIRRKPFEGSSDHVILEGFINDRLFLRTVRVMYISDSTNNYKRQGINDFNRDLGNFIWMLARGGNKLYIIKQILLYWRTHNFSSTFITQ